MIVAAHNLLAFSLTWDTAGSTRIRGILIVVTGIAVLMGSVYLLLGTNLGSRLGFLVAMAGLSGWMVLMAFVWAIYGIGYVGTAPHWEVEEVVTTQTADDLSAAQLAKAHDLADWERLAPEDPARGEAQATAGAALTTEGSRVQMFESESDFVILDAYRTGGKDENFFNNWVPGPHPPHYTIVQVQEAVDVEVAFGEAPPPAEPDTSAPIQSVVMVRDLGTLRVPAVLTMLASLIVFAITCNVLHRRDKAIMAARATVDA